MKVTMMTPEQVGAAARAALDHLRTGNRIATLPGRNIKVTLDDALGPILFGELNRNAQATMDQLKSADMWLKGIQYTACDAAPVPVRAPLRAIPQIFQPLYGCDDLSKIQLYEV